MNRLVLLLILWSPALSALSQIEQLEEIEVANSNIHGFVDVAIKNDYITPRGLVVTDTGVATQVLAGLGLDLYKNPSPEQFVNKISLIGFIWNDFWSKQHDHKVGSWNECDWGLGVQSVVAKNWTVQAQYLEFLSPPHYFKREQNVEFLLVYEDSDWKLPLQFKPYGKFFWAVDGDSTVLLGKRGHTFDIELGLIPTMTFDPITITVPTWVTVGPASFWNGGNALLKAKDSNWGVFSTGLQLELPLSAIPKSYGNWYLRAGVQYYHLINDSLVRAEQILTGHSHKNLYVASCGFGFRF